MNTRAFLRLTCVNSGEESTTPQSAPIRSGLGRCLSFKEEGPGYAWAFWARDRMYDLSP